LFKTLNFSVGLNLNLKSKENYKLTSLFFGRDNWTNKQKVLISRNGE